MDVTTLNRYVEKNYQRWLDYSVYHCALHNMPDEAGDILHEVIVSLFKKDPVKICRMMETKKEQLSELDFYVIRMIMRNITSPTSPYQYTYNKHKYLKINITGTDFKNLDFIDSKIDEPIFRLHEWFEFVSPMIDDLGLPEYVKRLFLKYRCFFQLPDIQPVEPAGNMDILYHVARIIQKRVSALYFKENEDIWEK